MKGVPDYDTLQKANQGTAPPPYSHHSAHQHPVYHQQRSPDAYVPQHAPVYPIQLAPPMQTQTTIHVPSTTVYDSGQSKCICCCCSCPFWVCGLLIALTKQLYFDFILISQLFLNIASKILAFSASLALHQQCRS